MSADLVILDGHFVDYMVPIAHWEAFAALGLDPDRAHAVVDGATWEALYAGARDLLGGPPTRSPGGSSANTAAHFAHLGGRAALLGQVGDDDDGDFFRAAARARGCGDSLQVIPGARTGRCLVFVRPDGERVMRSEPAVGMALSRLGAAEAVIREARWMHLSGYLLEPGWPICEVRDAAMDAARDAGVGVSMDIGAAAWLGVNFVRPVVRRWLDLAFLNATEARDLTTLDGQAAAAAIAAWAPPTRQIGVVITQGERGAIGHWRETRSQVRAAPARVVDTTGAGDAFAGGFLSGWLGAAGFEDCMKAGATVAGEVVARLGAGLG